jgi:hypothetical protein
MFRRLHPALAVLCACESTAEAPEGFQGGEFETTILSVSDMCAGGAIETLFMPDGNPTAFDTPMELPGVVDLPWTHTITFAQPFREAQLVFEEGELGEDSVQALGGVFDTVELDAVAWPGCFVNAEVDFFLQLIDSNAATGSAILSIESFDEAGCPAEVTVDPCDVKLDLRWQRL